MSTETKVLEIDYHAIAAKCKELVLWKNTVESAVVFTSLFSVQVILMSMSFLSIVGYFGIALLLALLAFRGYLKVSGQKDTYGILDKLDRKLELSNDETDKITKTLVARLEMALENLRELLLLKNVANSLKFGFALYMLTYVGARFNFLTLCLVCTVCAFVLPKVYELKKAEIDQLLILAKDKMREVSALAWNKLSQLPIPGLKTKSQ